MLPHTEPEKIKPSHTHAQALVKMGDGQKLTCDVMTYSSHCVQRILCSSEAKHMVLSVFLPVIGKNR